MVWFLQSDYKMLKSENNALKLRYTELQGDMAECRDHANSLDIELAKSANRCEVGCTKSTFGKSD